MEDEIRGDFEIETGSLKRISVMYVVKKWKRNQSEGGKEIEFLWIDGFWKEFDFWSE